MKDMYIVTSTGVKNGVPYASLSRIVQGKKENGDRYAFLDSAARTIREAEEIPIGTVITYETTRASK